jgi:hypothetical protein
MGPEQTMSHIERDARERETPRKRQQKMRRGLDMAGQREGLCMPAEAQWACGPVCFCIFNGNMTP